MTPFTEKERSILSIARTLHNVHGPRFFMLDAYLSMTTRQYRAVLRSAEALEAAGLLEFKITINGSGYRITQAGLDYLQGVGE